MRSPVAQVFASEWPRLVATLMRDLGDLGLAEDAAQDAFVEAARRWGPTSTPDRPGAWLLTTARRKAIDQLRRRQTLDTRLQTLGALLDETTMPTDPDDLDDLDDPQLAMIFGCCHPSLSIEAQVALTLRHVGGLSTAQIAAAFVVPEATMAKRLVRAKHKVREANVPFVIPTKERLADRLAALLQVIYLIFTEGHTPTGEPGTPTTALVRGSLCDEARWLSRMVADLLPGEPEANGLAALLCFTEMLAPTLPATSSCSTSKTGPSGTRRQSPRDTSGLGPRSTGVMSDHSSSRRRLPRSTPWHPPPPRPTGRTSSPSIGACWRWCRRR